MLASVINANHLFFSLGHFLIHFTFVLKVNSFCSLLVRSCCVLSAFNFTSDIYSWSYIVCDAD